MQTMKIETARVKLPQLGEVLAVRIAPETTPDQLSTVNASQNWLRRSEGLPVRFVHRDSSGNWSLAYPPPGPGAMDMNDVVWTILEIPTDPLILAAKG
jgi:hypothetical protein